MCFNKTQKLSLIIFGEISSFKLSRLSWPGMQAMQRVWFVSKQQETKNPLC